MSQSLLILAQFIQSVDPSYDPNEINTMANAIQSLDQLFEDKPKIIVKNIDQLLATLEYLVSQPESCWLLDKAHFYDFLVSIVNKYPKILKSQNTRGPKIFRLALDIVSQISNEVSQEWMNPPDGFKDQEEQDVDSETIKQIMSSVDVLSETIGFDQTLAHLQPLFLEYIQKKEDWRYQYAPLIIASQIVNQEVDVDTISLIVQWAISMTEHDHPKVKYAALHLLGQYCQDLNNDFQEIYYNSLIPVTVRLLQDPIPRVVAHTFACMCNFFEKCKALWRLQSILGQFLNPILHYIKNGNTWVKEAALSTLASFANTEGAFGPNLPSVFQLCGEIINSCVGKEQYNQVLNQSFQMLSMLLTTQKKQLVQPYLNQFLHLLYNHRDLIDSTYFLQAWSTICCEYDQFTELTQFYPHLMQKTNNLFVDLISDDDCAQGLKCLKNTFLSFKTKAKSFASQTLMFAKSVFQTSGSERVKEQAMILQAATVTAIKPNQPGELGLWFQQAYRFYEYLIALLQDRLKQPQFVVEEIPYIYQGLTDIISSFENCLSGPNLIALARKQFELVEMMEQNFEGLKTETAENQDQYEDIVSDDSDIEIDKMCFDFLEDALERVPQVLQILLKACVQPTAKSEMLELCQSKIQIYLTKQDPLVHFGLSLTVQIIKSFTYYEIKSEYNNYLNLLSHYIQNPQPKIRNMVVYGFNLIFKKVPPTELGVQYVTKILELLSKSFTADFQDRPRDKDHLFFIKHCKDNVISALGNLLKYFGNSYPTVLNQDIYKFWISHLPLEADKEEGNEQQEILIEFLNVCPALLINDTKDLLEICEIYARFVMKRGEKQHKQIVEKTKQSLMMMKEWSLFKDSANYLWNSLSESHRQTLTRLMTD